MHCDFLYFLIYCLKISDENLIAHENAENEHKEERSTADELETAINDETSDEKDEL